MRLFRSIQCFKIQRTAQSKNHEPRQTKWQTTRVSTSGVVDFFIGFPCFSMHSSRKTTRPRDGSCLFMNTFSSPKARHFTAMGDRLHRSLLCWGISYILSLSICFFGRRVSASQNCGAATSVDAPKNVQTYLFINFLNFWIFQRFCDKRKILLFFTPQLEET